ncbi:hypothetical protein GFD17_00560 [Bifidobacterium sp. SMB2]|uniref:Uncharacterized protein n=1 Tax=Bifidobacterium saimiriisciurei TaxID=2661627 RepID=A0ABX0C868_9BIFI|nr:MULTISPECIES: hypothetical protein [Bifidobacterium]NEG95274.1 hypothetical protein [Bifidobacterium sp. SMB2]NEH11351.1 hypothetical protein [Bifidobacterium saimiriisciurei]
MSVRRICTLPASVTMLSQGNLQNLAYVVVGTIGALAAVGCLARWLTRLSREREYYARQAALAAKPARRGVMMPVGMTPMAARIANFVLWYVGTAAAGVLMAASSAAGEPRKSVTPSMLESACGISDIRSDGRMFQALEDLDYPMYRGVSSYGDITFVHDGRRVAGGVKLLNGQATVYQGDFHGSMAPHVESTWFSLGFIALFAVVVALLMLLCAFILMTNRDESQPGVVESGGMRIEDVQHDDIRTNRPFAHIYEHPKVLFLMLLGVFISCTFMAVSLPTVDARWVVPATAVAIVMNVAAFVGPFMLVRRVMTRTNRKGPAA